MPFQHVGIILSCATVYVATFLRLWRQWVKKDPKLTSALNYITEEAFKDVLLSCHFVVLFIKYFGLHHPEIKVPLHQVGTDVCKDLFSSFGSWNMNKRTYSVSEAVVTMRSRLQLSAMEAKGNINVPKKDRRKKEDFDRNAKLQAAHKSSNCSENGNFFKNMRKLGSV